jgi:hypothetical protein
MKGRGQERGLVRIKFWLAMCEAEGDRAGGASDVDQSDGPLQLVMAGLVEEIAEADDSRGFPDKVRRQARRGAAEQANHRIEFLSPALQIGASYREVSAIQSGSGDEQNAILPIPELVLDAHVRRRDEDWRGSLHKRGRRVRKGRGREQSLGMQSRTNGGAQDQHNGAQSAEFKESAEGHKWLPRPAQHS